MKKAVSGIMLTLLFMSMSTLVFNVQPINAELIFSDNFNDGVADGWTENLGTWSVIDGEYFTSIGIANSFSTLDVLNLSDCVVETNLRFTDSVGFRAGIVFRYADTAHCYAFEISNEYDVAWIIIYTPEYPLYGYKNENMSVSVTIHPNVNYTLKVKVQGDTFTGYLDNQELFSWTDGNYTSGKVGVHAHRADVFFDNFTVYSSPKTIYVDDDNISGPWDGTPEHPHQNITDALEHASAGDIIYVYNGTYYENVVVNKTVSLIGENKCNTIIDGIHFAPVVVVVANNVTISGFTLRNGLGGIEMYSNYNNIHDNNIIENIFAAIYLYMSTGNTFTANNVTRNRTGIGLVHSGENTFKSNLISNNSAQALVVEGNQISDFLEDMDTSNSVNGKPVYYWVNQKDNRVPNDAGYVALVNCSRILVQSLIFHRSGQGVLLAGTSDSIVENVTVSTDAYGIYMVQSNNVTIKNNNITYCNMAMQLTFSKENNVIGNNVVSNGYGVEIWWSNNNNISRNVIGYTSASNGWGISLTVSADGNNIYENQILHNPRGMVIQLFYSGINKIYHNNFIENSIQVHNYEPSISTWDDGYPFGGNYWSDHNPPDIYRGLYQNETGSDGVGDIPYTIDGNNTDRYPLIYPYGYISSPDVNGDEIVNIQDILIAALAFGTVPGDSNWNPDADLDGNGIINILDLVIIGVNFGKTR